MLLDIDPKVDYIFKRVFGVADDTLCLIDLLQAVLQPGPGHVITTAEVLNPFNDKETLDDKLSILDVKVRDQGKRQFHVEMQLRLEWFFPNRTAYYWAKFHQTQLLEGDAYQTLRPTISIWFVNEVVYANDPRHHLIFELRERLTNQRLTEDLAIHIIQLPHFTKNVGGLTTALDRWCYFLRYGALLDPEKLPPPLDVPPIRHALEVIKMFTQSEHDRERYEARLKARRDHISDMLAADQRGEARGRAQGEARGHVNLIRLCERLLNLPAASEAELLALPLDELRARAERLQTQVQAAPR